MRAAMRIGGLVLIVAGVLCLTWAVLVWRWQDPFTRIYTERAQHRLAEEYAQLADRWRAQHRRSGVTRVGADEIARDAVAFRRAARPGDAIGRIVVGRLGLDMILVEGTDDDSLRKGPGRDRRTYMPGQHRLVYIAGHRTTYLAPFAHIDDLRTGDSIRLELPYATFVYRVVRRQIVGAEDLFVLRSPRHELLRLQACHPRFFASHRYLVDALPVRVEPRGGRPYRVRAGPA